MAPTLVFTLFIGMKHTPSFEVPAAVLTTGGFLPGNLCSKARANPATIAGANNSLKLRRYRSVIHSPARQFLPVSPE
jgi:hypothetical protein